MKKDTKSLSAIRGGFLCDGVYDENSALSLPRLSVTARKDASETLCGHQHVNNH